MAETVTLQIPEALYQRLAIAAGATRAIARTLKNKIYKEVKNVNYC